MFIIDATDARKEKTILFPLPTILFQLWPKNLDFTRIGDDDIGINLSSGHIWPSRKEKKKSKPISVKLNENPQFGEKNFFAQMGN